MPSWKPTIVVLILAAVCVIAAWYTWSRDALGGSAEIDQSRTLLSDRAIPVESITRLTIKRHGDAALIFERAADGWKQVEPFAYPMQAYSMIRFATLANQIEVSSVIDDDDLGRDQTRASLSLDPPLATLTIEWANDRETVHFGRRGVGGRAYLQRGDDERIYVVSQELHERVIDESPNLWREPRLFAHAGADSVRVETTFENGMPYMMEREQRRWALAAPYETRIDQNEAATHLAELADLRTRDFIADQPATLTEYGLDRPVAAITVVTPVTRMVDGQPRRENVKGRLLIGAPRTMEQREFFAMIEGRPVVVAISAEDVSRVLAFGHLIAKTASGVDPANVGAIRIIGDVEFSIERDREDPRRWISSNDPSATADAAAVLKLLSHLTELRALDVRPGEYPFEREVASVTFGGLDRMPIDAVRIAKLEDGTWVMSNGDGLLRVYQPSLDLPLTPQAFGLKSP